MRSDRHTNKQCTKLNKQNCNMFTTCNEDMKTYVQAKKSCGEEINVEVESVVVS